MKRKLFLFVHLFLVYAQQLSAQPISKGSLVRTKLYSSLLENKAGENPTRSITVYLPPGYHKNNNQRYPVIYWLHGYTGTDSIESDTDAIMDEAIAKEYIRPVIFVRHSQHTTYRGSFYTNSGFSGRWSDFITMDLVNYIDKNFRTIPKSGARGICGHSMGGYGAIKIAMLHPDVFSHVFAIAPGALNMAKNFGPFSESMKMAAKAKTMAELGDGMAMIALARVYTPNPQKPPFYCNLPLNYESGKFVADTTVVKIWLQQSPYYLMNEYIGNLQQLKSIKIIWGKNDELTHIPETCREFSIKLEMLGITHDAEEYVGGHTDKIYDRNGQILNNMLPFFNRKLSFE